MPEITKRLPSIETARQTVVWINGSPYVLIPKSVRRDFGLEPDVKVEIAFSKSTETGQTIIEKADDANTSLQSS